MLPLPVGTERVWLGSGLARAYPEKLWFRRGEVDWGGYACDEDTAKTIPYAEVYHVPQPAPADKPSPLDQLAAEAQAEGEDAAPKRQLCKHPEFMRGLQMPGPNNHGRVWCGVCGHHFIGKPPEPKPQPPAPRRTAREVAEEVAEGIALAYGLSLEHHAPLVRSIAAAIERDRQQRPEVRDKAP